MADYKWPAMDQRRLMGKRTSRLDGPVKASGRAKYSSDQNLPGMLYGMFLTSPHAHAKVTAIDTSAAEATSGVTAVRVLAPAGTEIQWAGWEVASLAATSEDVAREALSKIKVTYEVMPHLVREEDASKVGSRAKPAGEQVTGDPVKALAEAEAVAQGEYGTSVITHCCHETHGQTISWKGDQIEYWPSTQSLSDIGPDLARGLKVPATQIHVQMDYMGGGFGSKFLRTSGASKARSSRRPAAGGPLECFWTAPRI